MALWRRRPEKWESFPEKDGDSISTPRLAQHDDLPSLPRIDHSRKVHSAPEERVDDILLGAPARSTYRRRRQEIEAELRKEFGLENEDGGDDDEKQKCPVPPKPSYPMPRHPLDLKRPPAVPRPRLPKQNLPPIPKVVQGPGRQKWGGIDPFEVLAGGGVDEDSQEAGFSARPAQRGRRLSRQATEDSAGEDMEEEAWWRQEQRELERKRLEQEREQEQMSRNKKEANIGTFGASWEANINIPTPSKEPAPSRRETSLPPAPRPTSWRTPRGASPMPHEENAARFKQQAEEARSKEPAPSQRETSLPSAPRPTSWRTPRGASPMPHEENAARLKQQAEEARLKRAEARAEAMREKEAAAQEDLRRRESRDASDALSPQASSIAEKASRLAQQAEAARLQREARKAAEEHRQAEKRDQEELQRQHVRQEQERRKHEEEEHRRRLDKELEQVERQEKERWEREQQELERRRQNQARWEEELRAKTAAAEEEQRRRAAEEKAKFEEQQRRKAMEQEQERLAREKKRAADKERQEREAEKRQADACDARQRWEENFAKWAREQARSGSAQSSGCSPPRPHAGAPPRPGRMPRPPQAPGQAPGRAPSPGPTPSRGYGSRPPSGSRPHSNGPPPQRARARSCEPPEVLRSEGDQKLMNVKAGVMRRLDEIRRLGTPKERSKEVKNLLREWHPDKNPNSVTLANDVFKFIQAEKDRVL